ncbi:4Fe-4S binding protein [Candidatus Halobeggiatoa sp. HSG11]|nr:4Fe-4S binding protein [Candidatus Halobeggiatoa sp. HSG11]
MFSKLALRLLKRLFATPESKPTDIKTVLDSYTAVAITEACMTTGTATASSNWQLENTLNSYTLDEGRGALSTAIGLSLSGIRATTFLTSPELMTAQDLLVTAVGRHIPLVIHLTNQTLSAHAGALGSGHKTFHASADLGCFVLHATTVQEAVDFSLIARRVAELTLIPGLVAMDNEQLSIQEVCLPSPELMHKFLGDPNEQIASPTPAQQLLFGETRRRIPRWFDPDQPVMHGAIQGPESWALGAVSKHPYFSHHLEAILDESLTLLSELTGRQLESISSHKTDNAELVLVAQGSAIETMEAVADYMRDERKMKVGVLGVRNFRPFSGSGIANKLQNKQIVAVLERVDTPLAEDPPLMRQVRAALERASENNRLGKDTYPNYPTIKKLPRFRSVVYGLGGYPLRVSDLIELCETIDTKGQGRIFLGFEFERGSSIYPKRQILLDNLHRYYPNIAGLGLKSQQPTPNLAPDGAFTIAIHSVSTNKLNLEAANLLYNLNNGWIRSRSGLLKGRAGWFDIFTYSNTELKDLGDDLAIDIAVLTTPYNQSIPRLSKDGLLLVVSNEKFVLPQAKIYHITTSSQPTILGALFGMLLDSGKLEITARKILTVYENSLQSEVSESELANRLEQFTTGLETVSLLEQQELTSANTWNDEAPLAVRHLGGNDDNYSSLPRFWDQVGVLYRNNEMEELTPDPYLTTGTIPPLTSTFHDLSIGRQMLPAFNPNTCTGCGQCWTRCPESAIGSIVISPTALLNAGIKLASAEALQMITSKLASNMHKQGRDKETENPYFATFIQTAFTNLKDKLPFNEERKQAANKAITALVNHVGELPIARTEAFFHEKERFQHDSGEFLSIVINSDACKACGLCIEACEPEALIAAPQTTQDNNLWQLWERLPDTAGNSIENASKQIGSMPAVLLSRHCQLAIAGGDNAEAGSGEKLAVRLAMAITEFQRQPLINNFIKDIIGLRTKITTYIQDILANALPSDDLEILATSLNGIAPNQAPLSALTEQIENTTEQDLIDTNKLRRLVKISQDLKKLHWQLTEGEHGLGRSRLSLAIAPGTLTDWAGHWPDNPFQVPVAVDMNGDTANLAIGLLEGQLRKAIESVALLRQAHLELEKPDVASRTAKLAILPDWNELSREEQQFCPPLLMLGNDKILTSKTSLNQLLNLNLPIKVILFTDLDIETRRLEPSLLALAQNKAYVLQTSISHTEHFLQGIKEAFAFAGPALIYVYTPSPERHGFAPENTVTRANEAVNSRMFPLFKYNPDAEGVFGSRISLEGNPEPEQTWISQDNDFFTPANWALNEQRFASYFVPEDGKTNHTVADYLAGKNKTAFVTKAGQQWQVRPEFLTICKERKQVWQILQELAGLVTPFTADVEARLTQQVADKHQAELDDLKQEYEAKIEKLRTEMETEMAARVKSNLMSLAGYD